MSITAFIKSVCCLAASLMLVTAACAEPGGQSNAGPKTTADNARSNYDAIPLGRSIRNAPQSGQAGVLSTSANTANQPGPGKSERSSGSWWDTLCALALVIGLIFLLRHVINRFSGKTPTSSRSGVVEVMARVGVAPKQQVLLLRLGGRVLLVGQSANGMNTLADINDPDEVASVLAAVTATQTTAPAGQFTSLFGRFGNQNAVADRIEGVEGDQAQFNAESEDQLKQSPAPNHSLLERLRMMTSRASA